MIDFGCLAVGDPACDLCIAWTFFHGASRRAFRDALPLGEDCWLRARAWALWRAVITLACPRERDHAGLAATRRLVEELLAD